MADLQVVNNHDGRLEVFGTRGPFHMWQDPTSATGWSNWTWFPSLIATQLAAGRNQDGRLEVFVTDTSGTLFHMWQTAPGSSIWSNNDQWETLGGGHQITQLALGQNADGRLEVFAIDTYGTVFHMWQTAPNTGWSPIWQSLGGGRRVNQVAVGRNQDGRLEVFVTDTSGTVLHLWQISPGGGWANNETWETLGSGYPMAQLTVGQNSDGRLEVFGITTSGAVVHLWQMPAGVWPSTNNWQSLGGPSMDQLVVGQNQVGRLEVFGIDTYGTVLHTWQVPGSGWSSWESLSNAELGGVIAVGQNQDGRLEAFNIRDHLKNPGAALDHCWQLAPNSGWGQWQPLTS